MEPIDRAVDTKKGEWATVPCYDFTSMVLSIVHNNTIMKKSNFIENFDIFTGESTIIGPRVCGDLHTNDDYVTAKQRFCRSQNNFPLPIIMFYDKTFSDYCGLLSTAPAIFIIGIFNQHCRSSTECWRCLGFVPNLNYRKGKFWK